jgi:hypothetical protein
MLLQRIDFPFLNGEGIVPAFLVVFWVKEQLQAGYQNDQELKSVLYTIITGAIKGELISSYYDLNEVILARYKEYLGRQWHPVDLDQRNRMSQFAHGLTLLLVRRNWKQTVRQFWPDVTHPNATCRTPGSERICVFPVREVDRAYKGRGNP